LPNVGKSTLFNALLKKQIAFVANYPFATIEPNVGVVPVPDERLEKLAEIVAGISTSEGNSSTSGRTVWCIPSLGMTKKKPPIVPATVKFVDIAGLVKGANEGAGLGNKFLSHIREVSIIAHVVRAFDPSTGSGQETEIIKVGTNPKEDYQTINTELMLADLATIQNAQSKVKRFQKPSEKDAIEKLFKGLNSGKPAREIDLTDEEKEYADTFFLLSSKPEIIVLNVSEQALKNAEQITQNYADTLGVSQDKIVVISAKIEAELAELSEEEQIQYLEGLGLKESGLERLIRKAYETLGLISFLTAGEKEVRAWTIGKGANAVEAAGEIHTDFTKKFIKAEVVSFADFVKYGGWKVAREKGKTRFEGKNYVVRDGDVVEFKIGT
jgi:hypothetical protein